MKKEKSKKRAFTLAEVLIAASIALIILLASVSFYITYQRSFTLNDAYLDIHANARLAMDWMIKDARWATRIVQVRGPYVTSDTCVILEVPSINAAGDVIGGTAYDYIVYLLQGDDIMRRVDANGSSSRTNETRIIAEYCSALLFSSNGVTLSHIPNMASIASLAITVTVSKNVSSITGMSEIPINDTINSLVTLRNKS